MKLNGKIQIVGGNPNNEHILISIDDKGNSIWRQHWFLTKTQWDEWENSYNESEATQDKLIHSLGNDIEDIKKEVDSLDDNYVTSGVVNVETQELIFTDKNGGNFTVTNSAALFTDTDTYVMSGEYNPEMGEVTFLTNMDTTFKVTGFAKDLTDTFTDSASLDGNTLTFIRNNNQTYDVDLSSLTSEGLWSEKPTGNNIYRDIGNIGIGTDSPQTKLHIKSSGEIIRLDSTSLKGRNYLSYYDSGNKRKGYVGYGGSDSPEHLSIVNDELGGNIQFFVKDVVESSHNKIISANFDDVEINGNVKILNNHTLTINDYTLPINDGDDGQILKTDGNGNLNWSSDETNTDKFLKELILVDGFNNSTRCVTKTLQLTMSDDSIITTDISSLNSDNYVANLLFDDSTNILTLVHKNDVTGNCDEKPQQTVDLSSLNTNTSIWTERIESGRPDKYHAYYNLDNIGIGTVLPKSKLHIEGPNYDESSIRFLNSANENEDYWMIGSRSFSEDSGGDGFEIGRNFGADTDNDLTGGKFFITKDGDVSIGNGYQPSKKLEVSGDIFIDNTDSTLTINDYTLPSADGDEGQILKTDGNGTTSWGSASGRRNVKKVDTGQMGSVYEVGAEQEYPKRWWRPAGPQNHPYTCRQIEPNDVLIIDSGTGSADLISVELNLPPILHSRGCLNYAFKSGEIVTVKNIGSSKVGVTTMLEQNDSSIIKIDGMTTIHTDKDFNSTNQPNPQHYIIIEPKVSLTFMYHEEGSTKEWFIIESHGITSLAPVRYTST